MALSREDIVGRMIARVVTSFHTDVDGFTLGRVLLQTDEGTTFEVSCVDPEETIPIEPMREEDLPTENMQNEDSLSGRTIAHVVSCRYWPSFGVMTQDGWLLYLNSDAPDRFCGVVSRVGETYSIDSLSDYWDKSPICA